jgi:hydrogenase expression/formation protein HypE
MGAKPLYLSAGFIIEEGMPIETLAIIADSMAETARRAGVIVATGDTKVVAHGECDGLFINTAGIGLVSPGRGLNCTPISAGDAILVSGTVGDHGVAILGARDQLRFQADIASDCAPLNDLIGSVMECSSGIKWMRDPTRGGVAAVLTELVESQPFGLLIREKDVPVAEGVAAVCELLGFDPLHLANEGKVVMVVAAGREGEALELLRAHPLGRRAAIIGVVSGDHAGQVITQTSAGGRRRLRRPAGELLPRIC